MPDLAVRLARSGTVPGLIPAWERGVGEQIARNARPTRLSGNTLWIHANTMQWERELRAREKEVIERLAQILGVGVIRQLAFE
jgi:predicted nucleic acid-binding Zn ribbon protein